MGVKMKYLIIILTLLVIGCAQQVQEVEIVVVPEPETHVVGAYEETEEEHNVMEFTVQATDKGFSPEVIEVSQGETVRLFITNTMADEPAVRIGITGIAVESFYHQGGSRVLEFTATEKGSFEFGDESAKKRKGLIIVS